MMSKNPIARAAVMLLGAAALVLSFASAGADARAVGHAMGTPRIGPCEPTTLSCVSTFAFGSTRDHVKFLEAADGTWTPWLDPRTLRPLSFATWTRCSVPRCT